MKVFVTGAAGFIGAEVTLQLLERGHEVHGLLYPAESHARIEKIEDRCILHDGDLANLPEISRILAKTRPDAAVHLAWYAVPGEYWNSPENLNCVSHGMNLAKLLSEHGCKRLVAAGTCAEYDWSYEELVEDETPCNPRTLYGAAKYALFLVLRKYCEKVGMELAWARFSFLFGPGEHPGRLVPSVIAGLMAGKEVPCTEGNQERDFLHVEDAASATVAVLEHSLQGAVNIGAGYTVPVRTLVEILAQRIGGLGRPLFGTLPTPDGEPLRLAPKVVRLNSEVHWRPRHSLETGLAHTVECFSRTRQQAV